MAIVDKFNLAIFFMPLGDSFSRSVALVERAVTFDVEWPATVVDSRSIKPGSAAVVCIAFAQAKGLRSLAGPASRAIVGRLQSTGRVRLRRDAVVVNDGAPDQAFGTARIPPRPFMGGAFAANEERLGDVIAEEVGRVF